VTLASFGAWRGGTDAVARQKRVLQVAIGRVVRFDEERGFGFITPDDGGEDVFVHASVLDDSVRPLLCGTRVEFDVMGGDRGLKAFRVQVLERPRPTPDPGERDHASGNGDGVLTSTEFEQEVTNVLIDVAPAVTGSQIVQVRKRLVAYAQKHGWVRG
jgi:CspA family cold shock protein